MTFEAVDADPGKAVAAFTKLTIGVNRDGDALWVGLDMTANASRQTVLGASDAGVHGIVPLMQQELHVIPAHDLGGFDATLAPGRWRDHRLQRVDLLRSAARAQFQKQAQKQADDGERSDHSPMPISM